MGDFLVAFEASDAFEAIGDAEVDGFDGAAGATNDMMVMVFAVVKFVAVDTVAEVAATEGSDFFHCVKGAVDGDDIAS